VQPSTFLNRVQYFEANETAVQELSDRFTNEDLVKYGHIESLLLDKEPNSEALQVISQYPEIEKNKLIIQLQMFKDNIEGTPRSLTEAASAFRALIPDVQKLFHQVRRNI